MKNVKEFNTVLPQSIMISNYLERVADLFHEFNNVEKLLVEQKQLFESFKIAELPSSREEFENRAILFQILRDLEYFLQLKRSFVKKQLNN